MGFFLCLSSLLPVHPVIVQNSLALPAAGSHKVLPQLYFLEAEQTQSLSLFSYMTFSSPQQSWWLFAFYWPFSQMPKRRMTFVNLLAMFLLVQLSTQRTSSSKSTQVILTNLLSRSFSAILLLPSDPWPVLFSSLYVLAGTVNWIQMYSQLGMFRQQLC